MKTSVLIARSLLGVIFLVFGLNFFFNFMPPQPAPTGAAGAFEGGLFGSGYFFQFLKVIEILSGLMLLVNRFAALFTIVLLPIIINIFLFHTFLMPLPAAMVIAVLIVALEIFLIYAYRKYYMSILTVSSPV